MASVSLRAAIAHAAVDNSLRQSLASNPALACSAAGYKLDEAELHSITEVISSDSFGVNFAASGNLPALFEATANLVNEIAPASDALAESKVI